MELIGTGAFSKVYKKDKKTALVKSICSVKACISEDWHNSINIFPKYKNLNEVDNEGFSLYECELYNKVKAPKKELNPKHYIIYKQLVEIFKNSSYPSNSYDNYSYLVSEFEGVKSKKYREALINMVYALTNFGSDMIFEISPRNIAVKNGKLILLDVFYFKNELKTVRESKQTKW